MKGFRREENVLIWENQHETLRIEPWGRDSLRIRATPDIHYVELPGALLEPLKTDVRIEIGDDGAVVENGKLRAEISALGRIRFLRADSGAVLLEETVVELLHPPARGFKAVGGNLYRAMARFMAYEGERFYGLGQHRHGRLDQKGCVIDLSQHNSEVTIPFLLSSRGYGLLWHNPAIGRVELGETGTRWIAEATGVIDYWITAGDTWSDITERYAEATGHPRLLPEWASGFWQSKLRYLNQQELLRVAHEYKRRGLPLSVIVVDFFHWTMMGDFKFDLEQWPDPAGMVRELEAMGIKVMVSVWPAVNGNSENFQEMIDRGLMLRTERGVPALFPFLDTKPEGLVYAHYYDPSNPEARQYFWQKMRENYYKHGFRIFWLDACEPEMYPDDFDNLRYHIGNGAAVSCLYPFLHEQGFFEGMRAEGEEEIIFLCRSAWAGSQRFGSAVWSGDIKSTFEVLAEQVRAGLNIGLSGIPWWTTDIGGFHSGDPRTPYFRELIVRWFQYGVFCPLFRLHGVRQPAGDKSGSDNEVWSFGEQAYPIITGILNLRERLRPYIMEQMRAAHEHGTPPMRPLFFDFPADAECAAVEDQFMFGPDILVAPVVEEGQRQRRVYLPAGASWTDAWTGEILPGGQWRNVDAPLEHIPVYLRNGVKLPIAE